MFSEAKTQIDLTVRSYDVARDDGGVGVSASTVSQLILIFILIGFLLYRCLSQFSAGGRVGVARWILRGYKAPLVNNLVSGALVDRAGVGAVQSGAGRASRWQGQCGRGWPECWPAERGATEPRRLGLTVCRSCGRHLDARGSQRADPPAAGRHGRVAPLQRRRDARLEVNVRWWACTVAERHNPSTVHFYSARIDARAHKGWVVGARRGGGLARGRSRALQGRLHLQS